MLDSLVVFAGGPEGGSKRVGIQAGELRSASQSFQVEISEGEASSHPVAVQYRADSSIIFHELRNPLCAMSNAAALLEREFGERSLGSELVAILREESQRLHRLLDQFDESESESEAVAAPTRFDLDGLIRDVAALVRLEPTFGGEISLPVDRGQAPHAVWGDRDALRQVLWNLFLNATRAAGSDGSVCVSARWIDGGTAVRVDIEDTGPGVPAPLRKRVFEAYRSNSGGTGLGLSVARSIVEDHGGSIWIEQSRTGGARVSFQIPVGSAGRWPKS